MPSATAGSIWSWQGSNFHPDDAMTSIYTDPDHVPVYATHDIDANKLQVKMALQLKIVYPNAVSIDND